MNAHTPPPHPTPASGDPVTLKQLRQMTGLSQRELGAATGVTQPTVSHIERVALRRLQVWSLARYLDGCGAQLLLTADFGDGDTFVLYDSLDGCDDTDS